MSTVRISPNETESRLRVVSLSKRAVTAQAASVLIGVSLQAATYQMAQLHDSLIPSDPSARFILMATIT